MSRTLEHWQLFTGPLGIVEAKERPDNCWELIDRGTQVHVVETREFEVHYQPYDPFQGSK